MSTAPPWEGWCGATDASVAPSRGMRERRQAANICTKSKQLYARLLDINFVARLCDWHAACAAQYSDAYSIKGFGAEEVVHS